MGDKAWKKLHITVPCSFPFQARKVVTLDSAVSQTEDGTHRDMCEYMVSHFSLGRTTRMLSVNALTPGRAAETTADMTDVALARMVEARAAHRVRIPGRRYADMLIDLPSGVAQSLEVCRRTLSRERRTAISGHHARNPKGKHGAQTIHRLTSAVATAGSAFAMLVCRAEFLDWVSSSLTLVIDPMGRPAVQPRKYQSGM